MELWGDEAFEAADGSFFGFALGEAAVGVAAGSFAVAEPDDDDHVQGSVGVAVGCEVESVTLGAPAGCGDRRRSRTGERMTLRSRAGRCCGPRRRAGSRCGECRTRAVTALWVLRWRRAGRAGDRARRPRRRAGRRGARGCAVLGWRPGRDRRGGSCRAATERTRRRCPRGSGGCRAGCATRRER